MHSPIMSPLVWDLGHIAAYEDLWLAHRHAGLDLLRPDLAECYDAFETPRAVRGEIEALGQADARIYLEQVRARTSAALARHGLGDGIVYELVLRHELQHSETMRQTLAIAGLLPAGDRAKLDRPPPRRRDAEQGWIELPAGPFAMGANGDGFAYDNERPRHTVDVAAFQIARRPVSNASWMRFSEGGGYERREWWSDEGWAWKQEYDITHHRGRGGGPGRRTRLPRLLVRGRRLRPSARRAAAHRGGVGEGGDLGQETPEAIGAVWEWTVEHLPRLPRLHAPTRTASTRRCSSARTTACCAAARGRRTPASRP